MLSKIFKKSDSADAATAAAAKTEEANRLKAETASAANAQQNAQLNAIWQDKLKAALGDDSALLAIAKAAPPVDIKQAAVNSIAGEETLKLAEREFRTHDRRVHRAAKQRYEMLVARRETREGAARLIEAAAALVKEEKIPANRLVELDRAWLALDIALLDPAQRSEFEALAADLATLTRERGAHQLAVSRWTTEGKQALARLNVICVDVAAGLKTQADLAKAAEPAEHALSSMPAGEATAELGEALQASLHKAAHIDARLRLLAELEQSAPMPPVAVTVPATAVSPDVAAAADIVIVEDAGAAATASADIPAAETTPPEAIETAGDASVAGESAETGGEMTIDEVASVASPEPLAEPQISVADPAEPAIDSMGSVSSETAGEIGLHAAEVADTLPIAAQSAPVAKAAQSAPDGVAAQSAPVDVAAQSVPVDIAAQSTPVAGPTADPEAVAAVGDGAKSPAKSPAKPADRWNALPPIADAQIANALNARFEQWQRSQDSARESRKNEKRQQANDKKAAVRNERSDALAAIVQQAEVALAGGHLGETNKYLLAIEATLEKGAPAGGLRTRIDAVQAEFARLKGWQHWGGGRVREDLVVEAEVLAKAASDAEAGAKLPIKQHGDAIEQLRERWKELDKLGGATSRPLWQRFDAALKTAYLPVAAHLAKLKAVRQENLAARNALVAALDALAMADAEQGDVHDFRAITQALEQFQTEWRKLGPVEHTVPHKSREKLLERMKVAVARLEQPLHDARQAAQAQREKFIERAKALGADAAAKPQNRDLINKVRELQAEWQQHAKSLALARNVENALWKEFKAATDAIFAQRDAVFSARDAEFKGNQVAREALIARLAELNADTPAADIRRSLSEVDTAWRRAGEAPRAVTAKLDARFRDAREAAQKLLAGSAARSWHATIDALNAKRALCEEYEAQPGQPFADIEARFQALPALPPAWEQALNARLGRAKSGQAAPKAPALGDILLQLESALDMASPAELAAARRDLKLRAMKAALEGKPGPASFSTDAEKLTAEAIGYAQLDAGARDRLVAIIAQLRANGLKGGRS